MTEEQSKSIAAISAVTRKQIRGLGASNYHAVKVTESINPIGRQGRSYLYPINETVAAIYSYLERPRLKPETHIKLAKVLEVLLKMLGNLIPAAFKGATNHENSRLSQQLIKAISKTDATLAALKLDIAEIKTDHSLSGKRL